MKNAFFLLILSAFATTALATPPPSEAPKVSGARVHFIEPKDGATVPSDFTVKMGVDGFAIKEAGLDLVDQKSGHHHLIIDGTFIPAGQVVPQDANHIHYGKGQTEAKVSLKPGKHTLTLQFADGAHKSYGEPMSATITVNVKGSAKAKK